MRYGYVRYTSGITRSVGASQRASHWCRDHLSRRVQHHRRRSRRSAPSTNRRERTSSAAMRELRHPELDHLHPRAAPRQHLELLRTSGWPTNTFTYLSA